jgi:uncharacterized protein
VKPPLRKSKGRILRVSLAASLLTFILMYMGLSIYGIFGLTTVANRGIRAETPTDYSLTYDNVIFKSTAPDQLNLRGWWIPNPASNRVIILLHGQSAGKADFLPISRPLWEKGFNLLYFDFRGHGQSDGDHHSFGQYEQLDVAGAVNFVKSKGFKPGAIGVMGWSLGATTAILALSSDPDIKAAVSDSGYADLSPLLGNVALYPGMLVAGRLFRNIDLGQVKPEEAIKNLGSRHIFIIHGDQDGNIPVSHAYRLKAAGGANVTDFWIVPGAVHDAAYRTQPDTYMQKVVGFFNAELN